MTNLWLMSQDMSQDSLLLEDMLHLEMKSGMYSSLNSLMAMYLPPSSVMTVLNYDSNWCESVVLVGIGEIFFKGTL